MGKSSGFSLTSSASSFFRMLATTPRTAPCPCGSGRRYKDCHGALAPGISAGATDELMREAQRAVNQGRSADAERLLRRVLELAPRNTAAWNLLGDVLQPTDPVAASEAWWRVLDLDPDDAEASFNLGNRNLQSGEYGAAAIHYE